MRRFYLDKPNAKFLGVCAGIAAWTGWDALWIRLGAVAFVLMGFGLLVPVYFIIALVATARRTDDAGDIYDRPRRPQDYRSRFADIEAELRSLESRSGRY
jgi:phage shock protein PspC (stress-responsive transcriptional regulator)